MLDGLWGRGYNAAKMKKYLLSLAIMAGLLVFAPGALANEGVIKLNPVNSGTSCYALSIYADNRYEVEGACRGLVVPFSAEQTYYLIWSGEQTGNEGTVNWKRQTEVERGKFSTIISDKFRFLQVTAESDWNARKPSTDVVAKGEIENLPISGAEVKEKTETTINVYKPAATPTPTVAPAAKAATGSVFGAILRVLGTGLLILLGIVVVMSVITRRKGF